MDVNKRAAQYVKLRDKVKQITEKHKEELAPYNDLMARMRGEFVGFLHDTKQESAKTSSGTIYLTTKSTASLEDADAFMRHVIGTEAWDLLDRRANSSAVKAYIDENNTLPPGVKFSQVVDVGVRRS